MSTSRAQGLVPSPRVLAGDRMALVPYVPRIVLQWLHDEPDRLARVVDGSLVFIDISGFTNLSERLAQYGRVGAEEVTEILDAVFARTLDDAYADQGGLVKFGGDALLLLFDGRDHEARACRAAVGMRAALRTIGRIATSAGNISLRMSLGVHSGPLHLFLVGASHRELILAGPGTTATVAFESAANAGEIVVSPSTAAAVESAAVGRAKANGYLLRSTPAAPLRLIPPETTAPRGVDPGTALPVAIREHIAAGGGLPEHRQVAVGFVRFEGVDGLLDAGGIEHAAGALDELVQRVQESADGHEVTLLGTDVYTDGGKFILVAGAPQASDNNEERLLRSLRAILDAPTHLVLRAGASRGAVFAGSLGPPYRRTYTVMGDAVNVAARLMQAAPPGRLYATTGTVERSRTRFLTRPLEPLAVKGKNLLIEAHDVARPARTVRARVPRKLPVVGRAAELDRLRTLLAAAHDGQGSVVDLVGDAGVGKSRLIEELIDAHGAHAVVAATCDRYERGTPYQATAEILAGALGLAPDAEEGDRAAALVERVAADAPELEPWIPLLGVPLDLDLPGTAETAQLHPGFRKAQIEHVTVRLLTRLLRLPTLLVVEDGHWMDDASADLLARLLADVEALPWLACVARRDNGHGFAPPPGPATHQMVLGPLPPAAAAAVVTQLTSDTPLPDDAVSRLCQQSGGNPLFLLELVAARSGGQDEVPGDIEAAITARLDTLAPADRVLLRYAAVLGTSFPIALARAVLADELPAAADPAAWSDLAEFLDEPEPGVLRFRQTLVHDVAYEGLPYRLRRELHARAGRHLELGGSDAELLALHFSQAKDHERSWTYSRVAGDRARAKSASVEAAGFYQQALDAARHADVPPADVAAVAETLGDVCELAGRYAQGMQAYRLARRLVADDPVHVADLLRKEGFMRERSHRYDVARRWYRRGLALCEEASAAGLPGVTGVRLRLEGLYAAALAWEGKYQACIRWCRRTVEGATAAGDEEALAHAYYLLDWAYTDLGRAESARYRALALPIYERLGDLIGQANVLNNLGVDAYYEGRWSEALELYARSRRARQQAGDVVQAATAAHNIAEVLSDQGRLYEAEPLFADALRVFRAAGWQVGIALAKSNLGQLAGRRGKFDEARELLGEAVEGFRVIGSEGYELETLGRLARVHLVAGESAAAAACVEQALGRAATRGAATLVAQLERCRSHLLLADGDAGAAMESLERSAQAARDAGARYELALTLAAKARLLARTGRAADAGRAAQESGEILATLDVVAVATLP